MENVYSLRLNMLIQWSLPDAEPRIDRVLAIDGLHESAFCIDVFDRHAFPVLQSCSVIGAALASGLAIVLTVDPYSGLLRHDDDFSAAALAARDRAWPILKSLLEMAGYDIYYPHKRGLYIRKVAASANVGRETLYEWLRRFQQRGQTPNALLADYKNSGRPGPRPAKDPDSPKRGRRSVEEVQIEKETGVLVRKGINITEEFRARCRAGINEFFLKRGKTSLPQAYLKTVAKHFVAGYIRDGQHLKPVPIPKDERPSYWQFRNIYYEDRKRAEELSARGGKVASVLKRPKIGTRFDMQFGPMMACEIDATPGDVVLVHTQSRKPIGTATIYRIHDLFSGMIVGLLVTLESESWRCAMLTIDNMVTDKVAFCREYGIEIEDWVWPAHYMFRHLHADNGPEWKWNAANNLPAFLNASMHNVIAYRGDLKPIAESTHNAIKDKVDRGLPGSLVVKPQPGERDFRKEPILDLYQYTQLQIRAALDFNLYHHIRNYPLTPEMIASGVQPYPLELWNWGVENLGACYQELDRDAVRRALLPRADARVTSGGIQFGGFNYLSDYVLRTRWIEQAAIKSWTIRIAYDPRSVDYIYLPLEEGRVFERCTLTERWHGYRGQSWAEAVDLRRQRKAKEQSRQAEVEQGLIDSVVFQQNVVEAATRLTDNAQVPKTKNTFARRGSDERRDEMSKQWAASSWSDLASSDDASSGTADHTVESPGPSISGGESYIPAPDDFELISEARARKARNEAAAKQAGIFPDPEGREG